MNNIHKLIMLMVLLGLLVGSMPKPTVARAAEPLPPQAARQVDASVVDEYEKTARAMEPYIRVTRAGLLTLTIDDPSKLGVDLNIFNDLKSALDTTNQMLQSGAIQLSQVSLETDVVPIAISDHNAPLNCYGRNGYQWIWWGVKVFMNSCRTRDVVHLLTNPNAAALSILLATIFGTGPGAILVATVLVGLRVLGAVALANANRSNRGVVITSSVNRWSISSQ